MASRFFWYELMTDDLEGAEAFYKAVLGWNTEHWGPPGAPPYVIVKAGDTGVGGLMKTPDHLKAAGAPSNWSGYIHAADVDAAVESLRKAGGRIWLEPALRVQYYPPATIARLHKQYWRYGYWKARMAMRFPETLRWRQFLPPTVLLAGLLLLVGGLFSPWLWWILATIASIYVLLLVVVGAVEAVRRSDAFVVFGMPLAIATMHVSWGGAFLWSFATGSRRR